MDDVIGPIVGKIMLALIIVTVVLNFAAGVYLLSRFVTAQHHGGSTRHWSVLWGVGWLVLLAGLPTIFIGGILLIFLSTFLWVIAAILCWREPVRQTPIIGGEYGQPTEEVWPPPPDTPPV